MNSGSISSSTRTSSSITSSTLLPTVISQIAKTTAWTNNINNEVGTFSPANVAWDAHGTPSQFLKSISQSFHFCIAECRNGRQDTATDTDAVGFAAASANVRSNSLSWIQFPNSSHQRSEERVTNSSASSIKRKCFTRAARMPCLRLATDHRRCSFCVSTSVEAPTLLISPPRNGSPASCCPRQRFHMPNPHVRNTYRLEACLSRNHRQHTMYIRKRTQSRPTSYP